LTVGRCEHHGSPHENMQMKIISPCLWFDSQAVEAAAFYVSIFRTSSIVRTTCYPEGAQRPAGTVLTVQFVLDSQEFLALNGGPQFTFSPAVSFVVNCDTQDEIDDYWEKLAAGGQQVECGWVTDRFGLPWQIVPTALPGMLNDPDTAAAQRVFAAVMGMKKLDISLLERAFKGA
jgi:predicted 3-demethylubiquinone-9 3-methyltransferase (glyoxalase superfamily)